MGRLTDVATRALGPGKHEDGDGLRIVVSATGAKKWVLRYQVAGRRREMGLGAYPAVGLKAARAAAAKARGQIHAGTDPIDARVVARATPRTAPASVPTFTQVAAAYIRQHRRGWANRKHQRQWARTMRTFARPIIGAKRIDQVDTLDILAVLNPLWLTRPETASRIQGRLENIIDYATALKLRSGDNPARWKGHLSRLLTAPARAKRALTGGVIRHQPAMPYVEVPAFLVEVRRLGSVSAMALEFLILTATRTGETLNAQWVEIDLALGVWTIPAGKTKTRTQHQVPLSAAALAVLARVPRVVGCDYVFPGARHGRGLSNMALLMCMRGLGYGPLGERGDYVPHGFRSAFRDWAAEVTDYPREVCEQALGHAVESRVEAAYRRGNLLQKRTLMMEEWGSFCTRDAVKLHHDQHRKAGK